MPTTCRPTSPQERLIPDVVGYICVGETAERDRATVTNLRENGLPQLESAGWRVCSAIDRMRGGERRLETLLETTTDDNSRAMIEYLWASVTGSEAAGRHYPPQPRLEAKLAVSQTQLEQLIQLLLAGADAPGWTAMEEGWIRSLWEGNWRIAPAVAAMRQGERRPEKLFLNEDPRSDGFTDVLLREVKRREAEGAPAAAAPSEGNLQGSLVPPPVAVAQPRPPPAQEDEEAALGQEALDMTSPLDPEEEMMQVRSLHRHVVTSLRRHRGRDEMTRRYHRGEA